MAHTLATELGPFGVWQMGLTGDDGAPTQELLDGARELEQLGYGALWLGGSPRVRQAEPLLAATSSLRVATGITSIWDEEAAVAAEDFAELNDRYDNRFVLGLGVSHAALAGERYRRPYSVMVDYLNALDEAPRPVPADRRVLAALGPRMLELARDRAAGAHPYLVTVEHTARARAALGPDALLAPELKVVVDTDLARARETARGYLRFYLELPNYTRNLERLGFTEKDFEGGGSDRLLSEVFALGDVDAIRRRTDAFRAAGADHLTLQVVTERVGQEVPLAVYRALAPALID
ncbi:TIGR03620 family F420-dependent LLM class oxidoreductase [Streptomyces sp. 3MP-14]|uniref:TIGR03620 family F420-dependent LLM class oxidoreductase n=1 Tax=Streptomyces mimosae TaxID=2586635 RepID=A0A5N6A652_9ACTN|nr:MULTISPECIES: LLM class F420-dependent oxidoreductase [Streptomyces]KAB8163429.1 TIGR03620 family F420-dependent LLM class oxidoreductase [Streptomyces mimosae]KAB8174706.1 TIGR03620 family F420-dependent LLM class oxidoreductase [Streptomyces sp. 3MP-14]